MDLKRNFEAQASREHLQDDMQAQAPASAAATAAAQLHYLHYLFGSQPSLLSIALTNPSDSDISTADTITLMNQHSLADTFHPYIEAAAREIRDSLSAYYSPAYSSALAELPAAYRQKAETQRNQIVINSVFDFVKSRIKFVEDEEQTRELFGIEGGVELLIKPSRLVSMNQPQGDCDDHSMLVAALLNNFGIKNRFVTVGANAEAPGRWSHVYVMAQLEDGSEVPIDASHGKVVGWEVPTASRKGVWDERGNVTERKRRIGMDGVTMEALGAIDFGKIIETSLNTTSDILKAQFGQPRLAPNTYISQTKDGTIVTNQPFPAGGIDIRTSGGGLSSGTIVLVGIGLLALVLLKK